MVDRQGHPTPAPALGREEPVVLEVLTDAAGSGHGSSDGASGLDASGEGSGGGPSVGGGEGFGDGVGGYDGGGEGAGGGAVLGFGSGAGPGDALGSGQSATGACADDPGCGDSPHDAGDAVLSGSFEIEPGGLPSTPWQIAHALALTTDLAHLPPGLHALRHTPDAAAVVLDFAVEHGLRTLAQQR